MDSDLLCSLDKLLLQFAFHLEKDSQTFKHEKEQIQICTANILEKKQQTNILNENINKLEDELSRSIKQSKQNRDNCEAWKPTYLLFVKHEENLQEQLQNLQFVSEKDRKMYQEHVNQYREILKQYQTQYSESTMALEYHKKKAEMDELQNCVWAYTKKCKQQECTLMQLLEPAPFRSLRDWTLEIASLRVNTEEMLKKITSIKSNSSRLEKENAELQKEIQHFLKLSTISRQNEVSDLNNEEKNISEVKERYWGSTPIQEIQKREALN
ncbi:protein SIX6OS1 [Protopterus annectens]|uniref:protein SIX6OS1 n=1 Tax=Protopterus annectens TaxID=7888 RepID=UPI001CF969D0|nr:protein SIX6OS1 [Protopterus annectens]